MGKYGEANKNRRTHAQKCRECAANNQIRQAAARKAAEERNGKWAMLSPADQLRYLDMRLGVGRGAIKQRIKIAERMRGAA